MESQPALDSHVTQEHGGLYAPPEQIPYSVEKEQERRIELALQRPADFDDNDGENDDLRLKLNQSFADKYRK